jgi:hypothetical protein
LDLLQPDAAEDQAHDARWEIHPEGQWILGNHPDTTPAQRTALVDLLQQHKQAFAYSMAEMPGYTSTEHGAVSFQLKDSSPEALKRMWTPPRWFTPEQQKIGDAKVQELLVNGIVHEVPTTHPFVSEVTMPRKRAPDGSWTDNRFCVDLRAVNANTVVDKYTMPLPEDLFRRMGGARFISKLDLRSGFMQLVLDEDTVQHLGFRWRSKVYCFKRLPFGHVNATAVFQRSMDDEIAACSLQNEVSCFVDDLCIFTHTFEQHMEVLAKLLSHFHDKGLRIHPAKSIICADCVPYLGHLLSATELKPDPAKVSAMNALKPPTSVNRLQAHLGLFNYYRCYIPGFSQIAKPLYDLLAKDAKWVWGPAQQEAYDCLRSYLTEKGGALQQPNPDYTFHLYTDWSVNGVAAILNQKDAAGNEFMVACASRTCNPAEKNYTSWKGEMMAAVWAVKLFAPYLLTRHFFLHTDARCLLWLLTAKEPVGIQYRYVLALQEYRFSLVHKPGKLNAVADACSREPSSCMADVTGTRYDDAFEPHPLPEVYHADMTRDTTVYTHDSLARDLGIEAKQPKGKRKPSPSPAASAPQQSAPAAAAAAASASTSTTSSASQLSQRAAAAAVSLSSLQQAVSQRQEGEQQRLAALLQALAAQPSDQDFDHAVLAALCASNEQPHSLSQYVHHDTLLGGGVTGMIFLAAAAATQLQSRSLTQPWPGIRKTCNQQHQLGYTAQLSSSGSISGKTLQDPCPAALKASQMQQESDTPASWPQHQSQQPSSHRLTPRASHSMSPSAACVQGWTWCCATASW